MVQFEAKILLQAEKKFQGISGVHAGKWGYQSLCQHKANEKGTESHGRSKQLLPYTTLQHLKIALKNTERDFSKNSIQQLSSKK